MRSTPLFIALKVREKNTHHSSNMILGNWTWRGSRLTYCIISPCSHAAVSCISDIRTGTDRLCFWASVWGILHRTGKTILRMWFPQKRQMAQRCSPYDAVQRYSAWARETVRRYKSCLPYAERNSVILRFLGGWSFFFPILSMHAGKGKIKNGLQVIHHHRCACKTSLLRSLKPKNDI